MRVIILLFLFFVSVYAAPGSDCTSDPSKCTVEDFVYDKNLVQCAYNNYDLKHPPWRDAISNGTSALFREECGLGYACTIVGREKSLVFVGRKVVVGNNKDTLSVASTVVVVESIPAGAIREAAVEYFNREYCEFQTWSWIVIGVLALGVVIGCGAFGYTIYKKFKEAKDLENLEKSGFIAAPEGVGLRTRRRRIFYE
jgi:hypothetical protein